MIGRTVRTGAVALFALVIGASAHAATSSATRTVYAPNDPGKPRIVIIGEGYGSAEDSVALRLVDYDPAHDRVVYKVITP